MQIALVSREVAPMGGGGIGNYIAAAARLLATIAEVTLITTSQHAETYARLVAEEDAGLPPSTVRVAFIEEPIGEELAGWYDVMHLYSARVLARLRDLYPEGGPDVIEFCDFLGEGFVTVQAAEALDPFLERTCVCVRAHTSAEITEVLNGYYHSELARQVVYFMERHSLAHADRFIWQGGDILGTYERFYGADALAPSIRIRYPFAGAQVSPQTDVGYASSAPLRVLYAGRLERRKGVQNLVRAVTRMGRDDFRLTLLGGDTLTGPLGVSMQELLRLSIADDSRIALRAPLDRRAVGNAIRQHDLVIIPSLWECWPYAALEALHLNRPVLATPVGGLIELVEPEQSGWLASATDSDAIEEALGSVLDGGRELLERMVRNCAPIRRARELADEQEILSRYEALAQVKPRQGRIRAVSAAAPPLVSAVVPYYRSAEFVAETIESLAAQSYPRLEIVLVNDGSFGEEDWILAKLAARLPLVVVSQMNSGLGAARNFGVSQSRGRYVLPLDADNLVDPQFVARCVAILESRPEVVYVTSWSRYIEQDGTPRPGPTVGYQPLGNRAAPISRENVAGDAAAVIRRRIFDAGFRYSEELASYEDWHFYRELRRAGHFGAVIPERLLHYRVHDDSMHAQVGQPRRERLEGEMNALLRENGLQWMSSNV